MDMPDWLILESPNTKLEITSLILEINPVVHQFTWLLKFCSEEIIHMLLTFIHWELWFMNLYLAKDLSKEKIELKSDSKWWKEIFVWLLVIFLKVGHLI